MSYHESTSHWHWWLLVLLMLWQQCNLADRVKKLERTEPEICQCEAEKVDYENPVPRRHEDEAQ